LILCIRDPASSEHWEVTADDLKVRASSSSLAGNSGRCQLVHNPTKFGAIEPGSKTAILGKRCRDEPVVAMLSNHVE
jgi:hypothetical protein